MRVPCMDLSMKGIWNMIKLIISMIIFFTYPMTGCTVTQQQTQATVDSIGIIGKTITEVVKIYGKPIDTMNLDRRDLLNGDTIDIYDYEGFSVVFENGKATAVHYPVSASVLKGLEDD